MSKPLNECHRGGRHVGSGLCPIDERIKLGVSVGCYGVPLHQAANLLELFQNNNYKTEKKKTKLATRCLLEAALAVTFAKSKLLSSSKDLYLAADSSSYAHQHGLGLMIGGVADNTQASYPWKSILSF